jgi:uncharacterized protein
MTEKPSHHWFLIAELILFFVVFPVLYWLDWIPVHKVIPLIVLFVYCLVILVRHKRMNRDRFGWTANWKLILYRFLLIGAVIFLSIYFFFEKSLLADFGANRKLVYMIIMYPLLSAFPQEVIFREFFFYRYASIFRNSTVMLIANIILFAFAHVYFAKWIVIGFTVIGGLIFSLTYLKTRSLLVVTIEHTLYGLLILSSGLSDHFYKAF